MQNYQSKILKVDRLKQPVFIKFIPISIKKNNVQIIKILLLINFIKKINFIFWKINSGNKSII